MAMLTMRGRSPAVSQTRTTSPATDAAAAPAFMNPRTGLVILPSLSRVSMARTLRTAGA